MNAAQAVVAARPATTAQTRWALTPIIGFVGYLAAAAVQLITANDHQQGPAEWAAAFGIAALVTAIAVAVAIWALRGGVGRTRTTAATFGVLAALGIVVFWAGVPTVLGAGAVGLALAARRASGSLSSPGLVGMLIGGAAGLVSLIGLAAGS